MTTIANQLNISFLFCVLVLLRSRFSEPTLLKKRFRQSDSTNLSYYFQHAQFQILLNKDSGFLSHYSTTYMLSTEKYCLTETCYRPKLQVHIVVTGAPLNVAKQRNVPKQYFLLNTFMKSGQGHKAVQQQQICLANASQEIGGIPVAEMVKSILTDDLEITSFSKATLLQREPFLTMFYTIKSSPSINKK